MDAYDVYLGSEPVGKVYVQLQGLYYCFCCRCDLTGDVMHRLVVTCGDHKESLGVLVPMGDAFGLDTRLAVKRLGKGLMEFRVLPKHAGMNGQFVPLTPDEPFAYISRLKESYLARKNGTVGIVLKE